MKTLYLVLLLFSLSVVFSTSYAFDPDRPSKYDSPLKQMQSGIYLEDVLCAKNFFKIVKLSNGLTACVSIETKHALIEREWGHDIDDISDNTFGKSECTTVNGKWDNKFNTCDSVGELECRINGGDFIECKPPEWSCTEGFYCGLVCVETCKATK